MGHAASGGQEDVYLHGEYSQYDCVSGAGVSYAGCGQGGERVLGWRGGFVVCGEGGEVSFHVFLVVG